MQADQFDGRVEFDLGAVDTAALFVERGCGLIYLLGMVWDAISDPLIGAIADRTRSRWGRYRPYLLFGAAPYGLSIALLFTPPGGTPEMMFVAALAAHLLFRTGYTVVYMPYTAMIARMTTDYDSRTDLTAFKTFFVFCGNLAVSFAFYTLVMTLGDGEERAGFLPAAALIGIVAAGTAWLCFFATTEQDVDAATNTRYYYSSLKQEAEFYRK
ncbi:MAG: MFS transporter, partial [Alphaproteobacteria bacterium]